MTGPELNRAIAARNIPPLLFLYGEETFTLERTLLQLCRVAVPETDRDFNFNVYHGRDARAEIILDVAHTFPVFASHRLILVKDAQQLAAAELEGLTGYLSEPAAETILVFCGDKIDGRKKFFQEFKKRGELVEFKKLYENQIPAFVKEQARELGYTLTEEALALFCRRVGSHLQEVHGELVKLSAYRGEQSLVDVEDVVAVVSDTRVESIFELTDAMGNHEVGLALRLLGRILEEGTAPLLVLSMLVRHFRQLWKIRELLDQGSGRSEIPRAIGINPYFIEPLMAQARRFNPRRFRRIFELCLGADLALKSSGAHPSALLEMLVLDILAAEEARPSK